MRTLNRLSHVKAARLKNPGIYEDGGGLRLVVSANLTKRWVMRVTINGKRRERGLGSFPSVSLEEVRERASVMRKAARQGRDLAREDRRLRAATGVTFADSFATYFQHKQCTLSNGKHVAQWRSTMQRYVLPRIGALPVAEIDAQAILDVLTPIWVAKPETARRVLQRMEAVFRSAILRGYRQLASPCIGVAEELGTHRGRVNHHAALPWRRAPAFLLQLRQLRAMASTRLALEFLILTATRSGDVRGALWSEFNFEDCMWTIPGFHPANGRRTKSGEAHVVPLSERALEILAEARQLHDGPLVFPGVNGQPLSDNTLSKLMRDAAVPGTPHGFRSAFKDWAAEAGIRDEVSEAALAHADANRVRAAYRRTRFLEERVDVMRRWADFLAGSK